MFGKFQLLFLQEFSCLCLFLSFPAGSLTYVCMLDILQVTKGLYIYLYPQIFRLDYFCWSTLNCTDSSAISELVLLSSEFLFQLLYFSTPEFFL